MPRDPICCRHCGEDLLLGRCPNCDDDSGAPTFAAKMHQRLPMPRRAETNGVLGDGVEIIGPADPDYPALRDWLQRYGTE